MRLFTFKNNIPTPSEFCSHSYIISSSSGCFTFQQIDFHCLYENFRFAFSTRFALQTVSLNILFVCLESATFHNSKLSELFLLHKASYADCQSSFPHHCNIFSLEIYKKYLIFEWQIRLVIIHFAVNISNHLSSCAFSHQFQHDSHNKSA